MSLAVVFFSLFALLVAPSIYPPLFLSVSMWLGFFRRDIYKPLFCFLPSNVWHLSVVSIVLSVLPASVILYVFFSFTFTANRLFLALHFCLSLFFFCLVHFPIYENVHATAQNHAHRLLPNKLLSDHMSAWEPHAHSHHDKINKNDLVSDEQLDTQTNTHRDRYTG